MLKHSKTVAVVIDWFRRADFVVRSLISYVLPYVLQYIVPIAISLGLLIISSVATLLRLLSPLESLLLGLVVGFMSGLTAHLVYTRMRPPKVPLPAPPAALTRVVRPNIELEHNGLLWIDDGDRRVNLVGPLCPKDRATLLYGRGYRESFRTNLELSWQDHIGEYNGSLFCPECQKRYFFTRDRSDKTVGSEQDEVKARFEGYRRQRLTDNP